MWIKNQYGKKAFIFLNQQGYLWVTECLSECKCPGGYVLWGTPSDCSKDLCLLQEVHNDHMNIIYVN